MQTHKAEAKWGPGPFRQQGLTGAGFTVSCGCIGRSSILSSCRSFVRSLVRDNVAIELALASRCLNAGHHGSLYKPQARHRLCCSALRVQNIQRAPGSADACACTCSSPAALINHLNLLRLGVLMWVSCLRQGSRTLMVAAERPGLEAVISLASIVQILCKLCKAKLAYAMGVAQ